MDVSALAQRTTTLQVEYAGQTAAITYYPDCFNSDDLQRFINMRNDDLAGWMRELSRMVATWELTNNGQPLPTTPEGIAQVPSGLLGAIQKKIIGDMFPSEEEKRGSSEPTFSQSETSTPSSPISPNGLDSSTPIAPPQPSSESLSPT